MAWCQSVEKPLRELVIAYLQHVLVFQRWFTTNFEIFNVYHDDGPPATIVFKSF